MSGFQIARDTTTIFVVVSGLANMKNAPMLDAFLRAETNDKLTLICIDLSSCQGMDSTFMGLLVGTASELGGAGARLVVINPSEICHKLMSLLGLNAVLPIMQAVAVPDLEFIEMAGAEIPIGMLQRLELIRKAHRSLMDVSKENQDKFAAFMQALEADLEKIQPQ